MKITHIFIPMAAGLLVAVASCGQKQHENSDNMTDSIALQEGQLEQERLESVRRDSIRQDSLRRDSIRQQQEKISKAMPTVQLFGYDLHNMGGGSLTEVGKLRKQLVALGYEKINSNKYVLNPDGEPNVTVNLNYKSWDGEYDPEMGEYIGGGMTYDIDIIFSDEQDAADFYKKWKAARKTPWISESRSGKKVHLSTYGD